jgi:predicted NUDIX family phosphoesterase
MTGPRSEELVWVVPRTQLFDGPAWHGVWQADGSAILEAISRHGRFVPRSEAEADPSQKQIIPYLVLRDGDRLFLMHRTRAGGDVRLHDRYSIGVGGHMNPGDDSVLEGLRREWREEIEADFEPSFDYVGLLNDDTTSVGAVHLGVVYMADASGRPVLIRETHKLSGSFELMDVVRSTYDRMETWSQLVLDALAGSLEAQEGRTFAAEGESHP